MLTRALAAAAALTCLCWSAPTMADPLPPPGTLMLSRPGDISCGSPAAVEHIHALMFAVTSRSEVPRLIAVNGIDCQMVGRRYYFAMGDVSGTFVDTTGETRTIYWFATMDGQKRYSWATLPPPEPPGVDS